MGGGGGGDVTVGYKYYVGMHMALCHGPCDKLVQVRVGGKTAWVGNHTGGALTINKPSLFGGEKREGGIEGQIDIDMGGPDQGQNSYLAAKLGSSLLPAFRGVMCAVLRQVYIGMNPYLKDWGWLVQRIHTRSGGVAQWYDAKAQVGGELTVQLFNDFYRTLEAWYEVESGKFEYPATADFYYSVWDSTSEFFYRGVLGLKGPGPFGSNAYCNTYIPSGVLTRAIWVEKTFSVPAGRHRVTVNVYHDDGGMVWCNGEKIYPNTGDPTGNGSGSVSFEVDAGAYTVVLMAVDGRAADGEFSESGSATNITASLSITVEYVTGGWLGGGSEGMYGDMNPAHIIRECLTDVNWGMGYQETDIDDDSFMSAADTLYDEGMGISIIWSQQTSIEDFVAEILRHIDAALYVDRATGKFVIKLIRADYDTESLLVLDESNISSVEGYTKQTIAELVNEVTVTYNSNESFQSETVTLQNLALIQQQGAIIPSSIEYPGFTNEEIALKVCARDLKALAWPLVSATIYANRDASGLNIGDVFRWNWAEYDEDGAGVATSYIMRVTEIAFGDGVENTVRITCVQDVFALPGITYVEAAESAWEDPLSDPLPASPRLVTEAPYYQVVRQLGELDAGTKLSSLPELGYLMVAAGRQASEINTDVYVDSGAGYADGGTLDFCPCAALVGAIGPLDTTATLTDGADLDEVVNASLAQIGDEIVVIESITDGVATIRRGCLDTLPAPHADGASVIVWDDYTSSDGVEYVDSDEVAVKLLTVTGGDALDIDAAPEDSVTMDQRANRPYPPANVQIGGEYYPDTIVADDLVGIVVTWAHRDRTQQTGGTVLGWTDASAGPETGVTYSARLVRTDTEAELDSSTAISGATVTFAPTYRGEVRLEVWSVRGGVESMQIFEHTFDYLAVAPIYYDSAAVYYDGSEVYYEL